jgi:hypothetical protein
MFITKMFFNIYCIQYNVQHHNFDCYKWLHEYQKKQDHGIYFTMLKSKCFRDAC